MWSCENIAKIGKVVILVKMSSSLVVCYFCKCVLWYVFVKVGDWLLHVNARQFANCFVKIPSSQITIKKS